MRLNLPPGTHKSWRTESTLAQGDLAEEIAGVADRGTERLVRVEDVHHYRQRLVVRGYAGSDIVSLAQTFHRLDRRPPGQESTIIRMSRSEARRIGLLLIEAADAEGPDDRGGDQGVERRPNTESMTSFPAGTASENVSESGSMLSFSPAVKPRSEADRSSCFRATLSGVGSLLSSALISSRRIASTAICWPKAKLSLSGSRILSSMVTRKSHGSRPGEAVELHAPGLAGAWACPPKTVPTPIEGAAA